MTRPTVAGFERARLWLVDVAVPMAKRWAPVYSELSWRWVESKDGGFEMCVPDEETIIRSIEEKALGLEYEVLRAMCEASKQGKGLVGVKSGGLAVSIRYDPYFKTHPYEPKVRFEDLTRSCLEGP